MSFAVTANTSTGFSIGVGGGTTGQIKVWTGASFEAKPVKVWNATSWMEVARLEPPSGVYYAGPGFTSDSSTIVVGAFRFGGGWSAARLFRAPSWEEIAASELKEEPLRPSNTINRNK